MPLPALRLATALPIFIKWIGTPLQMYTRRVAETNPRFRAFVISRARWYNKIVVDFKIQRGYLSKEEAENEGLLKMKEDRAIIAGAELLSSTLGTVLTLLTLWISFLFYEEEQQAKAAREREEKKQVHAQISALENQVAVLEENLASLGQAHETLAKLVRVSEKFSLEPAKKPEDGPEKAQTKRDSTEKEIKEE